MNRVELNKILIKKYKRDKWINIIIGIVLTIISITIGYIINPILYIFIIPAIICFAIAKEKDNKMYRLIGENLDIKFLADSINYSKEINKEQN